MEGPQRRALILGGAGAVALLALLFVVVGADRVVDALATADPPLVVATAGLGLCWLAAWSLMLRAVLSALDVRMSVWTAFLVYSGAAFANNVTPFGQAGGEPVAALLISKVSGSRYETSLAGIASVDVLNVVPSLSLVFVGVGYYASSATVGDRLETAVVSAVALIATVVLVLTLVWRNRETLSERLPAVVVPWVSKFVPPRFTSETPESDLRDRLQRFFESIELVAVDRWRLTSIVSLSLAGWLFQTAAFATTFAALGYSVPVYVLLFVIPLANLAGAAPLPGGLGGIEAAFVALLVPTTGIAASGITAAVLIFRGAIYWMPVLIGGLSVSSYGVRTLQ